jgi:glyoxylase-like metal-dependent hydrolase (beta-lactamase superfamily II)
MQVIPLRYHDDNYCYFVKHRNDLTWSVVDPGDSKMILGFIKEHSLQVSQIIATHKHWDHIGDIEWFHEELRKHMRGPVELFAGKFFASRLNFQAQRIMFQAPPRPCALATKRAIEVCKISKC